ncbi:MAG TPA: hypothetical protein DHU55_10525 [Blastocatellia bacterium]|jgi:hypothetical protein|nr:hypothetical protein [Blastocatellia bacterium]
MKVFSAAALALLGTFLSIPTSGFAQQKKSPDTIRPPQLVRTTIRHEQHRLAYGGTVTISGAPDGSIKIEGWPRNEVDITAEIQLRADTEQDLDRLAVVNGFVIDDDVNHLRVLSTGTHDKAFMRAVAKKFPKTLLGLPWKIDYRIRVPAATDLEINAGRGAIDVAGVEGNIRVSAAESETNLTLSGGTLVATIATGKVNLGIPARTWRGVGADIRVAMGEVTVGLPPGFNGDIDAEILRSGKIEDLYGGLEPREKPGITPQNMKARAGAGGAFFRFTVGDGTIYIKKQTADSKP